MAETLTLLTYLMEGFLVIAALFAGGTWWATFSLRKKLSGTLIRWDKPSFGLWAALLFLGILIFLSGGMLSYAFSIRFATEPRLVALWKEFAALNFLCVSMLILIFAGLRGHHLHILSERGIYNHRFIWTKLSWDVELIPWEEVYDYYQHVDGALTKYILLLRDRRKITLEVPVHLSDTIERVINLGTEKYTFLQKYSQKIRRYYSGS
ncbi:MAG: hypothetical protein NZZ60_07550 [Bacteroidia bacterium]|nr:hypothetical protein [Bacteroidia bacterium]MCX7652328.1 hypothetical protein [Bacteroidia bacterium]MDW8417650.1 hypothetical protein [Bacteroidia bacterium]